MLLEFRFQNYKSFREEASFSMMAAPKQKGLDYSLFNIKKHGKDIKGLCSSVIYGSNAAGKTTVVGAMDTFRSIVLRGNIRNSEDISSPIMLHPICPLFLTKCLQSLNLWNSSLTLLSINSASSMVL